MGATLKVIGGQWKPVILCHVTNGTKRRVNFGLDAKNHTEDDDAAIA